jgi:hypothetical protein
MRLLLFVIGILATAGRALAQEIKLTHPPLVSEKSSAIQWLITVVFLVGCLVVAFKPAKRSKLE